MAIAYADMECLLKVDTKCQSCVQKTLRVLSSIVGVWSVSMDPNDKNLIRISGEVDPNILLKQLLDAGKHAELVGFTAKHPHLRYQNYNGHASSSYGGGYVPYRRDGYNYGSYGGGYNLLPEHPYGMQRIAPPQIEYPSSYNNTYGYQNPLPLATNVLSYPYQERDPYGNYYDGMNGCSIM